MRRALRRKVVVGAGALVLAYHTGTGAAPPKPNPSDSTNAPSWVGDELRILRSDVDSLRQRPDPAALAADVATLRNEVTRLSNTQADLERRLGATPPPLAPTPATTPEHSTGGSGVVPALVFLGLGAALGWVGGRLSQRWRDRRQRIRV